MSDTGREDEDTDEHKEDYATTDDADRPAASEEHHTALAATDTDTFDPHPGTVTFAGPPEPVRITGSGEGNEELKAGEITLFHPTEDATTVTRTPLGQFVCMRCGRETTISTCGGLEPPHECPGCERQGPFKHALADSDLLDVGTDVPPAGYADPPWRFTPDGISEERYGDLWADIRGYIREHWDAGDGHGHMYDGLTAYALSTWVRPNLTFVPHLLLMGQFTGGKTRLLKTLARVSHRAIVTASATPAAMFRLIDDYDVAMFISEYHGLEYDTRREVDNVIRAGQKEGEAITRAEQSASGGYTPTTFDPFTHMIVASQYEPADDVISRCISVHTSPSNRDMPAVHDEETAADIRRRALYARYRLLDSPEWDDAEQAAYAYLAARDITGRTREKLLSLVTIAIIFDRLEELGTFVDTVIEQDREELADSEDAAFVAAVRDLAFDALDGVAVLGDTDPFAAVDIPLEDVADRYNAMTGEDKSASWAGHVRKRLDIDKTRKRDGTVISDPDLGPKLRELCEDLGLEWQASEMHDPVRELDDDETYRKECSLCGNLRTMAYRHAVEGYHMCSECADEERAAHAAESESEDTGEV